MLQGGIIVSVLGFVCLVCLVETSYPLSHLITDQRRTCPQKQPTTDPNFSCNRQDIPATLRQCDMDMLKNMKAEMQKTIQKSLEKVKDVRNMVQLNKRSADKERDISLQSISQLKVLIKKGKTELVKMRKKQKAAAKHDAGIIEELEQDISDLQKRRLELEQLSSPEELHLLHGDKYPSKDWSEISVQSDLSAGMVRRFLSGLVEKLQSEIITLSGVELRVAQQYAVDVTMDPDTAHPKLHLSDDLKQVSEGFTWQNTHDNAERFNTYLIVLGKEGFSSGRFYYEVQVKDKTEWDLGVARESISRKGQVYLGPGYRYWNIVLRNGDEYLTATDPPIILSLTKQPQKVGVFVDYEEGLISFFDVDNSLHIYSFTGQTFLEKIFPYFSPSQNGRDNSAPLVITPVKKPDDVFSS